MTKSKINDKELIVLYEADKSALEIAAVLNCAERTIYTRLAKLRSQKLIDYREDFEITKQNTKLLASNQRYQDLTRIGRKQLKEKIKLGSEIASNANNKLVKATIIAPNSKGRIMP